MTISHEFGIAKNLEQKRRFLKEEKLVLKEFSQRLVQAVNTIELLESEISDLELHE